MKTILRCLLLSLGLVVFSWFVRQAGFDRMLAGFSRLGWFLPLLLVPYGWVYLADTLGWRFAFGAGFKRRLSYWMLFRVRWAGEAFNNVAPSAYVGGEALKVYLLHKRGVSAPEATSSVVVGKTLQTLSQLVFISLGTLAFMNVIVPESNFRRAAIVVLSGGLVVVLALFWLQQRGLFTLVLNGFQRLHLHLGILESRREILQRIDRRIADFYRCDPRHFAGSAGAYLGGWLLDTVEIYLAAYLLGTPMVWMQALAIEAFIGLSKFLGLFVPGALGVQESGIVFLCRAAGLPDAFGVTYAVIRRGRETVYAVFGWAILYLEEISLKAVLKPMALEKGNR
jgi:putative membrane protein